MRPLLIPSGTVLEHKGIRIVFIDVIDDIVFRFVREGSDEEYFIEVAVDTRVRFTVRTLLDEYHEGRLRDVTTSGKTLTEWQGRFLGLDRHALLAKEPRAVMKYDIAMAALIQGLPRNADLLHDFAKGFVDGPDNGTWSGRSVIRWMNNLEENHERLGAMKNRSGREKGRSQLPPIVDRLVHQAMALYFTPSSLKKMDSHALVVHAWRQLKATGAVGIGDKPPSKTAVINRINNCENKQTYASKHGTHEADRHFNAAGVSVPVTRPFELLYMDGVEFEQICNFSDKAQIPSNKMKSVYLMDAYSLLVFPTVPFAGPYRPEMSMNALLSALTPPVLDAATKETNPERVLFFGRIGQLRCDNDKALIPPSSIGNLASVVTSVQLAKKYGPDEKANIENFNGFLMRRLSGEPGTVLSARSRRRSIRRDPLAEAGMTRADMARKVEQLRLEWNDMGHEALGGRTPNDVMLEHVLKNKVRFTSAAEVKRHLARTVDGVLTTDGVVYDGIRYKWNRTGVTKLLSENLADQHFSTRLEGTARCEVSLRAYDWNLDSVDVLNDSKNEFVTLWSDDPDYTEFLTRYEHTFHKGCVAEGATGAQTADDRAMRRAQGLLRAWSDMHDKPFKIAKAAAAVLESAEVRVRARNIQDDPDLTNFEHLLINTGVGGQNRIDVPKGPSQSRPKDAKRNVARSEKVPSFDWDALEPAPRSVQLMLDAEAEDDLDGGVNWDSVIGDATDHYDHPGEAR